jgi:hypothetical protein
VQNLRIGEVETYIVVCAVVDEGSVHNLHSKVVLHLFDKETNVPLTSKRTYIVVDQLEEVAAIPRGAVLERGPLIAKAHLLLHLINLDVLLGKLRSHQCSQ